MWSAKLYECIDMDAAIHLPPTPFILVLTRTLLIYSTSHPCSPLIASVLQDMQSAVIDVCGEIESLCQRYEWLGELWKFLQQWEDQDRTAKLTPEEFQVNTNNTDS